MSGQPISSAGLHGRRFAFSARNRAAKAAQAAWDAWPAYAKKQGATGAPIQERWSYAIDRALEALTDGGAP